MWGHDPYNYTIENMHRYISPLVILVLVSACSNQPAGPAPTAPAAAKSPAAPVAPSADRKYLLERVDDAAVVQLYADGFAALPLKEKTLIWHLYQAALAGRDIYYDQRYAHNLDMRDVLEAIVRSKNAIDPAT